jgi:adenylate cyclase
MNRRLAAILAADIAGYSRLIAHDEERTVRELKRQRKAFGSAIAKRGGAIIDMAGDGVLAEFGSAVDAVSCAAAFQKTFAERNAEEATDLRLQFRIGINQGEVTFDQGRVYGEGVNVAARLEALASPGGIAISGRVYEDVATKLDLRWVDEGEKRLKNISRAIRVWQWSTNSATAAPTLQVAPDIPSIAVLAFDNLSADPNEDYFADGIVEDIVTGLSRIKWLLVIARNSTSTYKGKAIDVRQIARELGVRYVVQGSVRKAGRQIRIAAQLIDAENGATLWADNFDGAFKDVFHLQDQITEKVVAIVEPNLQRSEIERSRRKHPNNLDAYDLYLRAVPHTATQMPTDARLAMRYLNDALRLDPDLASAQALLAWCHEWCFTRAGFDEKDKMAALKHAHLAIASTTDDATALAIGGFVITLLSQDHEAGLDANRRALAINPSCATAMYLGALTNAFAGKADIAISLAERAQRLSPFDFLAYQAQFALGIAAIHLHRHHDATKHFTAALQANPKLSSLYFSGASAFALANRIAEAQLIAGAGLILEPGFRLRLFSELMVEDLADQFIAGGQLLGLPL